MKASEILSRDAFWDVKYDAIDLDSDSHFVIHKIFNFGTLQDIKNILKYFGYEKTKQELLDSTYLNNQALGLASAIFKLSPKKFSCYSRKQSNLELWTY